MRQPSDPARRTLLQGALALSATGVTTATNAATMRSVPLVMVILWFFLLIPLLIGRPMGAELSAIVTFTLFEAAYYSEIMRAGIQSISRGPRCT